MSQIVANLMAKLSGQSCGDFQLGRCLSIHTTAIGRPPEYSSMSDRPEKQASGKADQGTMAMIHTWIVSSLM